MDNIPSEDSCLKYPTCGNLETLLGILLDQSTATTDLPDPNANTVSVTEPPTVTILLDLDSTKVSKIKKFNNKKCLFIY